MKKKMFENIGEFLRTKREAKKLSQTDVAEALKVKPQFVSNWERGMSSPPVRLLKQIMRLFGISENELIKFMVDEYEGFLRQQLGAKKKR